mmetsp:Transcript_77092/g.152786  ORF Transcript_77092/g.152786 Transcript_77092/m.152786 type:complete len:356 (+) Transcript_77092:654-1721(+)
MTSVPPGGMLALRGLNSTPLVFAVLYWHLISLGWYCGLAMAIDRSRWAHVASPVFWSCPVCGSLEVCTPLLLVCRSVICYLSSTSVNVMSSHRCVDDKRPLQVHHWRCRLLSSGKCLLCYHIDMMSPHHYFHQNMQHREDCQCLLYWNLATQYCCHYAPSQSLDTHVELRNSPDLHGLHYAGSPKSFARSTGRRPDPHPCHRWPGVCSWHLAAERCRQQLLHQQDYQCWRQALCLVRCGEPLRKRYASSMAGMWYPSWAAREQPETFEPPKCPCRCAKSCAASSSPVVQAFPAAEDRLRLHQQSLHAWKSPMLASSIQWCQCPSKPTATPAHVPPWTPQSKEAGRGEASRFASST